MKVRHPSSKPSDRIARARSSRERRPDIGAESKSAYMPIIIAAGRFQRVERAIGGHDDVVSRSLRRDLHRAHILHGIDDRAHGGTGPAVSPADLEASTPPITLLAAHPIAAPLEADRVTLVDESLSGRKRSANVRLSDVKVTPVSATA
jgi:hypothetical protein